MKTKVISVNEVNGKKIGIVRCENESFEIIINKITGITQIWKAMYKKLERGYETEIFPKMLIEIETSKLKLKYKSPKELIENYMLTGII